MENIAFILLVGLPFVVSQQCTPTYRPLTHCLSSGPVRLTCPFEHWVFVAHATVYKARGPSTVCPSQHSPDSCKVMDVQPWIQSQCGKKSYCSYSVPPVDPDMCPGYTGALYVQLHYQCEGVFQCNVSSGQYARAMAMSSAKYSWTGSHAQIDGYPTGLLGRFKEEQSGVCCIRLPPHTMMLLTPSAFIKNPAPVPDNCNQRIEVIDSSGEQRPYWMCHMTTTPTQHFGCYDEEKWFTVKYVTSDTTVGAVFGIQVDVDHEKEFTMECGLQEYQCRPPTTTIPTPSTMPTTTTATPAGNSNITNIIIGVVVAALVIMLLILICCCCVCCRRGGSSEEVIVEEEDQGSSGYAFVTGMYLEGDNKSDLVIYRNPGSIANEPLYSTKSVSYVGQC